MSRPLRTLRLATGAPNLIVLLPGAYMKPEEIVQAGFFSAVEQRGQKLDIALVDLDMERITDGSAVPAVLDQILRPARNNYQRVWLGGISLGGLLTLCLNADHPGAVDGLCLIAPYPGSRLTTNAIKRAGGLGLWQATDEELSDPEFRAYRWLKAPPSDFPVFAGYGSEDRFAEGMQVISECFPEYARCAVPGGHDWPAWQVLWEHFLEFGHFAA